MSQAGEKIRNAIESRRDVLAKAIVEQHWKSRPDLERRYGATGYSKCLEDANFHLRWNWNDDLCSRALVSRGAGHRWMNPTQGRGLPPVNRPAPNVNSTRFY